MSCDARPHFKVTAARSRRKPESTPPIAKTSSKKVDFGQQVELLATSEEDGRDGQRFAVLSYEQVRRLDAVMAGPVAINGRGHFPTLDVRLADLVRVVRRRLEHEAGIHVRDIRINGGVASHVLAPDNSPTYNDLDLIFAVDLANGKSSFEKVKTAVLESLLEFLPADGSPTPSSTSSTLQSDTYCKNGSAFASRATSPSSAPAGGATAARSGRSSGGNTPSTASRSRAGDTSTTTASGSGSNAGCTGSGGSRCKNEKHSLPSDSKRASACARAQKDASGTSSGTKPSSLVTGTAGAGSAAPQVGHYVDQSIQRTVGSCGGILGSAGIHGSRLASLKEAYVHKMVKVTGNGAGGSNGGASTTAGSATGGLAGSSQPGDGGGDRWSLISLSNAAGRNVELKFVDRMRRQFEFSVDSFQIILDSLLLFYDCSDTLPMSDNFYPTVVAESVYGDYQEALYHLRRKLIATRAPEEIRGGGLFKYCHLLVRDYRPAREDQLRQLERYMCSRFFIDFPDLADQRRKLESYLANHFIGDDERAMNERYAYLMILQRVVDESTVCLMGHERRQTLNLIDELASQTYYERMLLLAASGKHLHHHHHHHHHQHHHHDQYHHLHPHTGSNSGNGASSRSLFHQQNKQHLQQQQHHQHNYQAPRHGDQRRQPQQPTLLLQQQQQQPLRSSGGNVQDSTSAGQESHGHGSDEAPSGSKTESGAVAVRCVDDDDANDSGHDCNCSSAIAACDNFASLGSSSNHSGSSYGCCCNCCSGCGNDAAGEGCSTGGCCCCCCSLAFSAAAASQLSIELPPDVAAAAAAAALMHFSCAAAAAGAGGGGGAGGYFFATAPYVAAPPGGTSLYPATALVPAATAATTIAAATSAAAASAGGGCPLSPPAAAAALLLSSRNSTGASSRPSSSGASTPTSEGSAASWPASS